MTCLSRLRSFRLFLLVLLGVAGLASMALAKPAMAQGNPPASGRAAGAGNSNRSASQVLNVGDVLQLVMPGEEAFNIPFKIDRDGHIDLPEAGSLDVAGLTLAEARARIREALSGSFRDMSRFDVRLREQRLLISVLGYVKQPGPLDLPAAANVQAAINAAGGLQQGAQLNQFQLRRANGETITFDYKKYLDTGDSKLLPRLRPLDELFVPSSPLTGNVQIDFDSHTLASSGDAAEDRSAVRIFGEVNKPGSYAYSQGMTVMDALLRAGGVTRYAGVEQIRIIAGNEPKIFNLKAYLDSGNGALNPPVGPGTTIFVPIEAEGVKSGPHVVYVMGEVAKPGAFEARQGTSFFDILANAGGPTRFAETRQIRIIRANGGVASFDLSAYTESGGKNPPPAIEPGDAIFVPEKVAGPEQASWLRTPPQRAVRVIGAVKNPGRFEWSDEMSLLDLIAQAGGPNDHGDMANIQVLSSDKGGTSRKFNLQYFLDHGGKAGSLPQIHAGYTITVPDLPQSPSDTRSTWVKQRADASIYVMGSVGHPGRYAFEEGLSFLDIIAAADGPTASADILDIRVSHRGEGRSRISNVNLAAYFQTGDDSLLPSVKPGDVIFVPDRNRNWLEESPQNTVRVLGAVNKPGRYRFTDTMSILDLLAEAGGPSKDAYQEKIVVVNLSCCSNEARVFNLVEFARTGNYAMLPLVRQGDTVYVPDTTQSDWRVFFDGVRDAVSVLTIFGLLKVLGL